MNGTSLGKEFISYLSQMRHFSKVDWQYYIAWIGLMLGLLVSTTGFLWLGSHHGVKYPAYVWNIPWGILIFVVAIGIDTIGHRTRYKERLDQGEGFVHSITIFLGITSVIFLCLGYSHREFFRVPALVFIGLSIFYSVIDEWMHWTRYVAGQSDRIEMWSHVFIFIGHIIMSLSWWRWYDHGYPGVELTLRYF